MSPASTTFGTSLARQSVEIVYSIAGIIETSLGFRFIFKFLNGNPEALLTQALYHMTRPLVRPFSSVFEVSVVGGSVIEWATVLAMVVYFGAAVGIVKLLLMSLSSE